jgi:hypothetical protein
LAVRDGVAVFAVIGLPTELWIPNTIEQFCDNALSWQSALRRLEFEPGCRLRALGDGSLAGCESLSSIEIPASVETLGNACFARCRNLSVASFEPDSKLSQIHPRSFLTCPSISAIRVPSRLIALCRRKLKAHRGVVVSLDAVM